MGDAPRRPEFVPFPEELSCRLLTEVSGATPGIPRPVNVSNPEEKTMQLEIDALKEAAAWPGADRRTLSRTA